MKFFYTVFVILASISITYSQSFEINPLQAYPFLHTVKTPLKTRAIDSINLPFIEDFSYPGPYPDPDLWLDKKVYVNETMAWEAPSVGVATFDAIDEKGRPYSNSTERGSADTLTSNYINLKDYVGPDNIKRNLSPADNVVMSFFLQPKGLGYTPKIADSIVLEFRDNAGNWNYIRGFSGKPDSIINKNPFDTAYAFVYNALAINETKYFYSKFQFRFRNFGRLGGSYEHWHLDYVKIAPSRSVTSKALDDLAFVEPPKNILKRYTAMPWKHAQPQLANELQTAFNAKFYNHFIDTRPATNTNLRISTSNGVVPVSALTLVDALNVEPSKVVTSANKSFPASLVQQLSNISNTTEKLTVFTEYSLTNNAQESKDLKKAAFRNDIVTAKTQFSDYFAYDDGTAEMQFTATGEDTQTAIRFKANISDSLRGMMFYFPFINGNAPTDALFNIRIWKDSLTTKNILFERKGIKPFYLTNAVDSLQGFTSFRIQTTDGKAIPIPAGDFYIGWQNVGDTKIPVGLDRNNRDKSQYIYQNIGGIWQQLKDPKGVGYGAIMVRPVFGSKAVVESSPVQEALSEIMSIYPNPASLFLNIDIKRGLLENYEISVYNLAGLLQKREILRGGNLDISFLNNGIYFLKIRDLTTQHIFNHKFIVQK